MAGMILQESDFIDSRATLEEKLRYILRTDRDFMRGIYTGLADLRAGRVKPWSTIKIELNLQESKDERVG